MANVNEESARPDIVLTVTDQGTGDEWLCAAFLGPLEPVDTAPEIGSIHDLLDRPVAVKRFTVVSRA